MSHFLMYVEHEPDKTIAEIMEPFREETEDLRYVKKEVYCKAGEYEQYYEKEIKPDLDEALKATDPLAQFLHKTTFKEKAKFEYAKAHRPNHLKDLIHKWEGGLEDENGNLFYVENENTKFDWAVLGGRYHNYFRTKDGQDCDEIIKADIDSDGMQRREITKAKDYYQSVKEAYPKDYWKKLDLMLDYQPNATESDYVRSKVKQKYPYGFLSKGNWVDCDNVENFEKVFDKWWESLAPDTRIAIVDCHI